MHRTSILKDNFYTICVIIVGLILLGLVGTMDMEAEQLEQEQYCEMVQLHKDGKGGWPDYNGNFAEVCKR